jgi:two-component system, chemotaxis family, CheB/CheR fusion protein
MMSNLLARHTSMPVTTVEDEMAISGNHVYLIPPGVVMHVTPGHLHLTPKNPHGLSLPIDIFFASMAEVYGAQAVGIVLSGTGSDGTRGALAIKAAGGLVMAQDPELAKFDGMPRSVIAVGAVDAVLPVDELPLRLLAHIRNQPYREARLTLERPPLDHLHQSSDDALAAVLRLLQQQCGIDFAEYKQPTVMRRIERRMQVRHTPSIQQYHELLVSDHGEIITLRRDMLIPVTSFFRDTESFNQLADKVIGPMVQQKEPGDTIRVWIAGVATGEEAYTVGMLFIEAFERLRRWPNLKIFATDVDQQCIETAGLGQYPEASSTELSSERRERFFTQAGERMVVKSELRQFIVFARHNLLTDPPFTKMDLVLCRNVLIYFKGVAQNRALRSLHYALVQGGALMLGSSES